MPFGTFLALGAAAAFLFGDLLFDWYLRTATAAPVAVPTCVP